MIRDKNPTFIGPTTGIPGIFHGAWWYYLLAFPYIFFHGDPVGFYHFIFLLSFLPTILFFIFLMKRFSLLTAIFFLVSVTTSSYFISTSIFPISSVLTLPFILLLLYATYEFFRTKKVKYQFLIFLSLGFIFEAEVPFGLFLIPAYLITIFMTREFRNFVLSKKNLIYSLVGLLIPLIPRLLFEFKNNFSQTKTILSFLTSPQYHNPKLFRDVFFDRINYFWGYCKSIFFNGDIKVNLIILILLSLGILFSYKSLAKVNKRYLRFTGFLIVPLFGLSLFYKDNFWANYFEGLSYFFLILLLISFNASAKYKNKLIKIIPIFILMMMFSITIKNLYTDFTNKKAPSTGGLKEHIQALNHIFSENKQKELCVKVYTPPVIPFTYNYLFNYYTSKKGYPYPVSDYTDNTCWYIIERDDYAFRVEQWRKSNIPISASLKSKKIISKNVAIELWETK